jgi:lipoprotein-anchoring transpeptidase ErfK/SrfK
MSIRALWSLVTGSSIWSTHRRDSHREPEPDENRETTVGESAPSERPQHRRSLPRRARFLLFLLGLVLFVLFVIAAIMEVANTGKIAEGVTMYGKPVGGMTRGQALEVARNLVKPMQKKVVLYVEDREFPIDVKSINFRAQPQAMAVAAYLKGRQELLPVRLFKRLFGMTTNIDTPVIFSYDPAALRKRIKTIKSEADREPSSTYIRIVSGGPDVVPSKKGIKVNMSHTTSAVVKALPTRQRRVAMVFDYKKPELTENDIGSIVLIQLSKFRLFLYSGEEYVNDFPVAVGMPRYPTPTGRFHITYKEKNPTWLPTSEWALDKQGVPQPPGPDNPLGGYWMDIGEGIGIHATPFVKSLGEQASHGCIRMDPADAETLYNAVKVGTPVFIVQ